MTDKRVGVLGATSLIGECLLPLLIDDGWQVNAFSRNPIVEPTDGVIWHRIDQSTSHESIPFWISLATIWAGTNHLPHTRDFSDGLFRRAVILPFNRQFAEHEQDRRLADKLKSELPGILRLSLDAYAGVVDRGEFTRVEEVEKIRKAWRREADQVAMFVDELCVVEDGAWEATGSLYDAFRVWAEESGISRAVAKRTFGTRLDLLGFQRGMNPARSARGYFGLKLAEKLEDF